LFIQIHHATIIPLNIYNQGNNRQKIFFKKNYLFFLNKIREHILPYANILFWCLMPNHFHLMVHVNKVEAEIDTEGFASSEALDSPSPSLSKAVVEGDVTHGVTPSHPVNYSDLQPGLLVRSNFT
jgi:hypothetical protein